MGFFDRIKKKKEQKHPDVTVKMSTVEGGQQNHVALFEKNADEAKPSSYYFTIQRSIKPIENDMVNAYTASNDVCGNVDAKICYLETALQKYNELKSICTRLGPDFQEYFSDMWEHCHNTRCEDFCYGDKLQNELNYLLENRDSLLEKQKKYDEESQNLEERLLNVIKVNSPVLQTDLYKTFDPILKGDIQNLLYAWSKNGKISRIKTGRTYKISYIG